MRCRSEKSLSALAPCGLLWDPQGCRCSATQVLMNQSHLLIGRWNWSPDLELSIKSCFKDPLATCWPPGLCTLSITSKTSTYTIFLFFSHSLSLGLSVNNDSKWRVVRCQNISHHGCQIIMKSSKAEMALKPITLHWFIRYIQTLSPPLP